jgi:hypothetical protein
VKSLQSKLKNDTERARNEVWSNLPKHFAITIIHKGIIHKGITNPVYNFLRGVRDNMISQSTEFRMLHRKLTEPVYRNLNGAKNITIHLLREKLR